MLRGNASEILAVAGAVGDTKGVDSSQGGWSFSKASERFRPASRLGCRSEGCQELGGQVQLCRLDASGVRKHEEAPCRLQASSCIHEVVCISGAVDFVAAQTA